MVTAVPDYVFKVHSSMCGELKMMTEKAAEIFPEIEAAKPGGSSGIRALCMLSTSIEKSQKLLEYASQSSRLYLAITGDTMLTRVRNVINLLEKCLSLLLTMVPVSLSSKISSVIDEMKAACFCLDVSDEEVGKALRGLILEDGRCLEKREREIVLFAASRLSIRSNKEIVLEERAIRRILSKVEENQERKKKILKYLLVLTRKYGKIITQDIVSDEREDNFDVSSSDVSSNSVGSSAADVRLPNLENRICLGNGDNSLDFVGGVEQLMSFMREALDAGDLARLKMGLEMLMTMAERSRWEVMDGIEQLLPLLVSILGYEVTDEGLSVVEILSSQSFHGINFSASGVILPIAELLGSSKRRHQELAVKILRNLSSEKESCTQIVGLGCVPKLVEYINDAEVGRECMNLLRNLCAVEEEARVSVAETDGCVVSMAELLENGEMEEQEHAVEVLLSLCSMRLEYCHMVMKEMIIPSLVYVSTNASEKGKATAVELLRHLRDVNFDEKTQSASEELHCHIAEGNKVSIKPSRSLPKISIKPSRSSPKTLSFFRKFIISSR